MALRKVTVSDNVFSNAECNYDRFKQSIAYAEVLQTAARLAGDTRTRVSPSTLRAFVKRHIDSPIIERAINNQQSFATVDADLGNAEALLRYARPGLTSKTRVAIAHHELVAQSTSSPLAVIVSRVPHVANRRLLDADDDLLPLSAFAMSGVARDFEMVVASRPRPRKRKAPLCSDSDEAEECSDDDDASIVDDGEAGDNLSDFASEDDHELDAESSSDDSFSPENEEDDTVILNLEQDNAVPEFDNRVELYESGEVTLEDGTVFTADHTYVVDGVPDVYRSVTTILNRYWSSFDAVEQSRAKVRRGAWPSDPLYAEATAFGTEEVRTSWMSSTFDIDSQMFNEETLSLAKLFIDGEIAFKSLCTMLPEDVRLDLQAKLANFSADFVRMKWNSWRDLGTTMHEHIEFFLTGRLSRRALERLAADGASELTQFLEWYDEWLVPRGLRPYRMELRIKDDQLRVCGSIDALFFDPLTGHLTMIDWKRSKGIWRRGFNGAMCSGVLSEFADCNYIHYVFQQNMYRRIIQKNTSLIIEDMYLCVCHPRQKTYDVIQIDAKDAHVERICEDYLAATQSF